MRAALTRYTRWLHTRWPAGLVEPLPEVAPDGASSLPGLFIVGDLTGIPLLKFAADSGTRAVRAAAAGITSGRRETSTGGPVLDLAIVGAGVSGMAAALEARRMDLTFELFEATEPFSTIANFPVAKPIFTYPTGMVPEGELQFSGTVKESLLRELEDQTLGRGIRPRKGRVQQVVRNGDLFDLTIEGEPPLRARRVIIAIGRSGDFRALNIPGERLGKVSNRLHDPAEFIGKDVLIVGGGDSAIETAIATASAGARVTISYRKKELSRPKPQNLETLARLTEGPAATVTLMMGTSVRAIRPNDVEVSGDDGGVRVIPNDAVFTMLGREAPLAFLRRAGVAIRGEPGWKGWTGFGLFFLFCAFVYLWKSGGTLTALFREQGWFPFTIAPNLPTAAVSVLATNAADPGFYYSLTYTLLVVVFGVRRIRRRRTPYVTAQTLTLAALQLLPLFLLPYFILPAMGASGLFDEGVGKSIGDALFPAVSYGHGREYWRAFGFVLAWPLFLWNVFTAQPLWWWLAISLLQTAVLIPLIVFRWGKGAYCGWICSCGAMAETLGDTHRHKMPHGPVWNRMNMVGQGVLAAAVFLLVLRTAGWALSGTGAGGIVTPVYAGMLLEWQLFGVQLNYKHVVDLFLAGIVGYGTYFWFSGRVWCRFACPLAALMHVYARFSRFRILAEKKKCISCNVCTSVCHQGIDVMNFANKGLPMEDPQCVRCSACVQSCPTGVLQFGRVDPVTGGVIAVDRLTASPVRSAEGRS